MTDRARELLEEVLSLPERANLAGELLASLPDDPADGSDAQSVMIEPGLGG